MQNSSRRSNSLAKTSWIWGVISLRLTPSAGMTWAEQTAGLSMGCPMALTSQTYVSYTPFTFWQISPAIL